MVAIYNFDVKNIQTTLVYLLKNQQILIAKKKRGFGVGKYNGIGGKLEPGETVEQAMIRETQEEIGVTPTSYQKCGVLDFDMYYKGEHVVETVHVFTCDAYNGEPRESEEMQPAWFDLSQVPYAGMYPTDKIWLPLVLERRGYFTGYFKFSNDLDGKLLDYKLDVK